MSTNRPLRRSLVLVATTIAMSLGAVDAAHAGDASPPPTIPSTARPAPPETPPPTTEAPPPTTETPPPSTDAPTPPAADETEPPDQETTPPAPPTTTPSARAGGAVPPARSSGDGTSLSISASAPTAPSSPVATPGDGSVTLTWLEPSSDGGAAIDQYQVQAALSAAGPWVDVASPTTRSYSATFLLNGTTYQFQVRAHNAAGWGPWSSVVSATPRTVSTAPTGLWASPGSNNVYLAWSAPTFNGGVSIEYYEVEQASGPNGPWTKVGVVNDSPPDHLATFLNNGATYHFRVRAYNAAGFGPYSTVVSAVPAGVPASPWGLHVTPHTAGQVQVKWYPPSNGGAPITSYRVERATSAGGPWEHIGYPTSTVIGTVAPPPGKTWHYRVVAFNSVGMGAYSSPVTYTSPVAVPSAPRNCNAYQMVVSAPGTMRITWIQPASDGGTPILFYKVTVRRRFSNEVVTTAYVWSPSTSIDLDVPRGHSYEVYISAFNKVGVSPPCVDDVWMSEAYG